MNRLDDANKDLNLALSNLQDAISTVGERNGTFYELTHLRGLKEITRVLGSLSVTAAMLYDELKRPNVREMFKRAEEQGAEKLPLTVEGMFVMTYKLSKALIEVVAQIELGGDPDSTAEAARTRYAKELKLAELILTHYDYVQQ